MTDLEHMWIRNKWVTVALIVFAVFWLVPMLRLVLHADANEACANLCNPYAPDLRAGACYCHTDTVVPEAIPGED